MTNFWSKSWNRLRGGHFEVTEKFPFWSHYYRRRYFPSDSLYLWKEQEFKILEELRPLLKMKMKGGHASTTFLNFRDIGCYCPSSGCHRGNTFFTSEAQFSLAWSNQYSNWLYKKAIAKIMSRSTSEISQIILTQVPYKGNGQYPNNTFSEKV